MKVLRSHARRIAALSILTLVSSAFAFSSLSFAQSRSFGVKSLVLDDNAGHTLQLTTPQFGDPGYASWIASGTLNWRVPIPPVTDAVMAFVLPGTTAGQVLSWDPAAPTGTGGAAGVWRPGLLSVGSISLATGNILIGNANVATAVTMSGDATLATSGALTLTNSASARSHLGAAASGANSDITSLGALTTAITLAQGGTNVTSYTDGDILYFNPATPTALTKLSTGGAANAGQVLTIDASGRPSWAVGGGISLASNYTWTGTHTYAPTTDITGAIVKATSFGVPTADIFDIESADGLTKYFAVDAAGLVALPGLTASLPVKTDASKNLTTGAINIAVGSAEITGTLDVTSGGTGATALAANGVMIGNNTSAVHVTSSGTVGQVLTSGGAGVDPTFQTPVIGLYAGITDGNQSQNKIIYYCPTGLNAGATVEDNVTTLVPRACRVTHFMVLPFNAPGGVAQSFTFMVRNHTQNTSQSVSISTGTPVGLLTNATPLSFNDGDEIAFEIITSTSSGTLNGARWSIEISAP